MATSKIKYYNLAIYKNNEKTSIKFDDFIKEIEKLVWFKETETETETEEIRRKYAEKRLRVINNKVCTIFKKIDKEEDNFILSIGKYRLNNKPFTSSLYSNIFEELDKNIIEIVNLVYYKKMNIIALESTQSGLKYKEIEEYFNSFFINFEDLKYELEIKPIMYHIEREKIQKTSKIESLSIGLNINEPRKKIIQDENLEKYQDGAKSMVSALYRQAKILRETAPELNVDECFITYKNKGKEKDNINNTMNVSMVNEIIDLLDYEDNNLISKLKLNFDDNGTMKKVDLTLKELFLEQNIYVGKNKLGPEGLGDKIIETFNKVDSELRKGVNFYNNEKKINKKIIDVPRLNDTPEGDYKFDNEKTYT